MIVAYLASKEEQKIIEKIERCSKLGDQSDSFAISRGEEGSKFALQENPKGDFWMMIPQDVERYSAIEGLRVSGNSLTQGKIENIYSHPKIWIIRIQKMRWKQRIVCCLDERVNSAGMKTLQSIISISNNVNELKYIQAILSSHLMNFWCINYLADDLNQSYLSKLPIPAIDLSNPFEKTLFNKIVSFVTSMLDFHKKLPLAKTDHEKTIIQRQIEGTDYRIDELVYELYGLTEEEIKIVEDSQDKKE